MKMPTYLLNGLLVISLLITITFSIIANSENKMILFGLGIAFSILIISRQFIVKADLATFLGKSMFFVELLLVFAIQFFDSSFVTQIYFFILISDATLFSTYRFASFVLLISYLLYILGRIVYFDYPEFSQIKFVIPHFLEYLLVFFLSLLTKYFIQQKNLLQKKKEELELAYLKLEKAYKRNRRKNACNGKNKNF